MFENIGSFFKKIMKNDTKELVSDTTASSASKEAAKERLQLVLLQDRANVSADFLELMKQEMVDVIKKYIVVEEDTIDVRIINQENDDGTQGAPSLCANIPILNIRNDNKSEKFRNEQLQNITKDVTGEENVEETSNDNVEIENNVKTETDVNIEIIDENGIVEDKIVEDKIVEDKVNEPENVEEDNSNNDIETIDQINDSEDIEENNIEEIEIVDETIENYDDYDEDDDDVTFDDLLKAAEEEEKMNQQIKQTTKKTSSKSKNGKTTRNSHKGKKTNKK